MVFIYPVLVGILGSLYFGAFINFCLLASSFFYHNSKEKKYLQFDFIFSILAVAYNIYLCFLFKFSPIPFGIAFIFLILGLYFYFKARKENYEKYHPLWHISCAVITISCFLGYILYR